MIQQQTMVIVADNTGAKTALCIRVSGKKSVAKIGDIITIVVKKAIPYATAKKGEIKKAVVGNGAAAKEQVNYMVKNILHIKEKMKYDESDAMAIALCHIFKMRTPSKKGGSWKSFIEANPDRVIN